MTFFFPKRDPGASYMEGSDPNPLEGSGVEPIPIEGLFGASGSHKSYQKSTTCCDTFTTYIIYPIGFPHHRSSAF